MIVMVVVVVMKELLEVDEDEIVVIMVVKVVGEVMVCWLGLVGCWIREGEADDDGMVERCDGLHEVKGCWNVGDDGMDNGDRCVGFRHKLKGICVLMKIDCCEVNGEESDVCGDCVGE